ncbi:hypothetical protein VP01_3515g1 [Puccinia sorghi]|uniref:Uncharacterized protein n=1 Tax=Puccinia sorghi TaxID=27349 RepID=A0A0L6UVM6_9BASI|nr:hypothetical protein VP01_3515g1 [Puccinia sorghi]
MVSFRRGGTTWELYVVDRYSSAQIFSHCPCPKITQLTLTSSVSQNTSLAHCTLWPFCRNDYISYQWVLQQDLHLHIPHERWVWVLFECSCTGQTFLILSSISSSNFKINRLETTLDQLAQHGSFLCKGSLSTPDCPSSLEKLLRRRPPTSSKPHQAVCSYFFFFFCFSFLSSFPHVFLPYKSSESLSLNPFDWYAFFSSDFFFMSLFHPLLLLLLLLFFFVWFCFLAINSCLVNMSSNWQVDMSYCGIRCMDEPGLTGEPLGLFILKLVYSFKCQVRYFGDSLMVILGIEISLTRQVLSTGLDVTLRCVAGLQRGSEPVYRRLHHAGPITTHTGHSRFSLTTLCSGSLLADEAFLIVFLLAFHSPFEFEKKKKTYFSSFPCAPPRFPPLQVGLIDAPPRVRASSIIFPRYVKSIWSGSEK